MTPALIFRNTRVYGRYFRPFRIFFIVIFVFFLSSIIAKNDFCFVFVFFFAGDETFVNRNNLKQARNRARNITLPNKISVGNI